MSIRKSNPSVEAPTQGVVATAIYSALAAHNIQSAQAWIRLFRDPVNGTVAEQIAAANAFWRLQFAELPYSTTQVRECLIDQVTLNDWLRLFCEHVVPSIITLELPRA